MVNYDGNLNEKFVSDLLVSDPCSNKKWLRTVLHEEFGVRASIKKSGDIMADGLTYEGPSYIISRDRA